MPSWIKFVGCFGNGLVVLLCVLGLISSLANGTLGAALVLIVVIALAVFNVYVIHKAARLLAEEEWLKSEVRKAELRRRLADLSEESEMEAPTPGGQP